MSQQVADAQLICAFDLQIFKEIFSSRCLNHLTNYAISVCVLDFLKLGRTFRLLLFDLQLSRNVRKPTMWILTRSDTNQGVQSLEMARGLKFCNLGSRGDCTIQVAKTKVLISFAVTAKLICVFVFVYAKRLFSHDSAQLLCRAAQICVFCFRICKTFVFSWFGSIALQSCTEAQRLAIALAVWISTIINSHEQSKTLIASFCGSNQNFISVSYLSMCINEAQILKSELISWDKASRVHPCKSETHVSHNHAVCRHWLWWNSYLMSLCVVFCIA